MVREELAELDEDFAGSYPKSMRKKFDGKRRKQSEVLGYTLTGKDDIKTEIDDATVKEAKKRDYKAEYKKFQSSDKSKKYRAELNAYNRKKGTYGNGDGKDASHKGGKIVGFEKESVNRGRAEKSRLKKEGNLKEKALKKNPEIFVPDKFSKVIDKLPNSKITKDNVIKLAKKLKVDKNDALRYVSYGYGMDFGLKEAKLDEMIDMTINNPDMWKQEKLWKYYTKATDAGKTVFVKLLKDKKKHYIWQAATASSIRVTDLKGKKSFTIKPKDVYQVVQLPHSGYKVPKGFKEGKLTETPGVFKKKTQTFMLFHINGEIDRIKSQIIHIDKASKAKGLAKNEKNEFGKLLKDLKVDLKKMTTRKKDVENYKVDEGKLKEGGKEIAKTILQQLGGNKFIAMTGAKHLGHTNKGLQMKIGRNSKGITHVIINLKASDTYEMEFIKLRGASRKVLKKVKGVYNDMLRKIFTKYTGMRTSL